MDIMLPKKIKILCLHEVSCNSVVMDYQIDSFKQKFIDYIEFVSLDAPFECTDESKDPVISKTFSGPYLSWFGFSSDRKTFVGYDKSLEYIISFMNTYGPFDGIFAFGQGINMATSLMGYNSNQGYKLRTKLQEKPKFAVLFNSSINRFLISDTFKPLPKYWIDDFDVPSYYCLCREDIENYCIKKEFLTDKNLLMVFHKGSHFMSNLTGPQLVELENFVKEFYNRIIGQKMTFDYEKFEDGLKFNYKLLKFKAKI